MKALKDIKVGSEIYLVITTGIKNSFKRLLKGEVVSEILDGTFDARFPSEEPGEYDTLGIEVSGIDWDAVEVSYKYTNDYTGMPVVEHYFFDKQALINMAHTFKSEELSKQIESL